MWNVLDLSFAVWRFMGLLGKCYPGLSSGMIESAGLDVVMETV